jgi:uncharacterized protein YceH (UPF0502 family)
MVSLTPDECRILGVLIEKELTTPEQYPLTLNAMVNGSNQKNNRDPVVTFDDDRVQDAIDSLRAKGLILRVDLAGSRVPKYRQLASEKIGLNRFELVILAELLLRGPQTSGELRGRASRMHHLDSLEIVQQALEQMMARPEPLVRRLPPSPGSRAERYVQLLCPDAHPIELRETISEGGAAAMPSNQSFNDRIARLEKQVSLLRSALVKISTALGEPDPTGGWEE